MYASGYGYDYGECVSFKEQLVASMKEYSSISDMEIYQIGATIGVHTGPYPLGMGFFKTVRACIMSKLLFMHKLSYDDFA